MSERVLVSGYPALIIVGLPWLVGVVVILKAVLGEIF